MDTDRVGIPINRRPGFRLFRWLLGGLLLRLLCCRWFLLGGIVVYLDEVNFFVDLARGAVKEHEIVFFVDYEAA